VRAARGAAKARSWVTAGDALPAHALSPAKARIDLMLELLQA
jgi:hypothetical protein